MITLRFNVILGCKCFFFLTPLLYMTMLIDKENMMFTKDYIMLANIDFIFPTFFIFRSSSLGVDSASICCSFFFQLSFVFLLFKFISIHIIITFFTFPYYCFYYTHIAKNNGKIKIN